MFISKNAKRFFYLETKDIYPKAEDVQKVFNKFDEVYSMMIRIIEYDIDAPGIEGLNERLPYIINSIVEGKLTRNDILTYFPQVWNKFESYVKKLLFIIDSNAYDSLAVDKSKTLPCYLDALGVAHNKGAQKHTPDYTYVFYKAKELRKVEAHDCELWSIQKYYNELSYSLLSYLLLTEHCLETIKSVIVSSNLHSKLPLYSGRLSIVHPCFFNLLSFACEYPGINFNGIKKIISKTAAKEVTLSFDSEGYLQSRKSTSNSDGEIRRGITDFEWEQIDTHNILCKARKHERFGPVNEDGKWISPNGIERTTLYKFTINDEGEITHYSESILRKSGEEPSNEFEICYLPEGDVEIYKFNNAPSDASTGQTQKQIRARICLDHNGLITSTDRPYRGTFVPNRKYTYEEDGTLARIDYLDYPKKSFIEVEKINGCTFFRFYDGITEEDYILKKLVFEGNRLIRVTHYPELPVIDRAHESYTLFDYYDSSNISYYIVK